MYIYIYSFGNRGSICWHLREQCDTKKETSVLVLLYAMIWLLLCIYIYKCTKRGTPANTRENGMFDRIYIYIYIDIVACFSYRFLFSGSKKCIYIYDIYIHEIYIYILLNIKFRYHPNVYIPLLNPILRTSLLVSRLGFPMFDYLIQMRHDEIWRESYKQSDCGYLFHKKEETANGSIPFVSHLGCPMSRYIHVFAISFENKWKKHTKETFSKWSHSLGEPYT